MGQYESITEHDKAICLEVWSLVKDDLQSYGYAMFNIIFTEYPLMANYFPFSGPGDEGFERHTVRFMSEVNNWILNIENPQELKRILHANGVIHAKFNLDNQQYVRMRQAFLGAVESRIGVRKFSAEAGEIFNRLLSIAMDEIMRASNRERVRRISFERRTAQLERPPGGSVAFEGDTPQESPPHSSPDEATQYEPIEEV